MAWEARMKRRIALVVIAALAVSAAFSQGKVIVAAAANLSGLKGPLSEAFSKKYPQYAAEFTFGASGNLVTQIKNGAPFQVFMSADRGFAQNLVDARLTLGQAEVYALGRLIFLTTKKLDLSKGLAVLEDPALLHWANCNPETSPYGRAAKEALTRAGLYDAVEPKLVTAQNLAQALQFALTGADAGFVNESALYSKDLRAYDEEGTYWFAVDPGLYAPIEQAFVVLKTAGGSKAAATFGDFLSSAEARAVFAAFGYGKP
jgi:molybdate transport system substrate-binding protein